MRVLLTTEFFLSGQSTHVVDLAIQLKKLGHEAEIVFTAVHTPLFQSYYGPMLRKAGIGLHCTSQRSQINQIIRRFKPDVIHCHSSTIFSLTKGIALAHRIPYVVTCHGLGFSHPKYQQALEHAKRIIAVGPNAAAEIEKDYRDKIVIIPNGVDIDRFVPAKKEKTIVLICRPLGLVQALCLEETGSSRGTNTQVKTRDCRQLSASDPFSGISSLADQHRVGAGQGQYRSGMRRTAREAMAAGCAVLLMNSAVRWDRRSRKPSASPVSVFRDRKDGARSVSLYMI